LQVFAGDSVIISIKPEDISKIKGNAVVITGLCIDLEEKIGLTI